MFIYTFFTDSIVQHVEVQMLMNPLKKAIVAGRKQVLKHQELAQQFGLARMTVTNVLTRFREQVRTKTL